MSAAFGVDSGSFERDQQYDMDGEDGSPLQMDKLEMQRRLLAKTKTDKTNILLKKSKTSRFLQLLYRCLRQCGF